MDVPVWMNLSQWLQNRKTTEGTNSGISWCGAHIFSLESERKGKETILSQQQKIMHNSVCCECPHPSPQLLQSHTNAFSSSWCRTKHSEAGVQSHRRILRRRLRAHWPCGCEQGCDSFVKSRKDAYSGTKKKTERTFRLVFWKPLRSLIYNLWKHCWYSSDSKDLVSSAMSGESHSGDKRAKKKSTKRFKLEKKTVCLSWFSCISGDLSKLCSWLM